MFDAPEYGTRTLSDLLPSVLAGLGVPGEADRLGLGLDGVRRVCVLLVDGLGARQLAARPDAAPFLTSAAPRVITTGFPSTTAVSLSSIGTGLTPGEHGLVGYLMSVPGFDRAMNPLQWKLHGQGDHVDLLEALPPEQFQPRPTVFERAAEHGIAVTKVAPGYQAKSGLTRAALRGGEFAARFSIGDLAAMAADGLRKGDRALVYAYHGDLDLTGHIRGPESDSWAAELAQVDLLAKAIAERMPPDAALLVTADHGMVQIQDPFDLDAPDHAEMLDGVRIVGGEPRARHIYTDAGAAPDVRARWAETLGADYHVLLGADVIDRGWFGPTVTDDARARIGDVLAVAAGRGALIRRGYEPIQSQLVGHHGSLTPVEREIPLLEFR
ncbi:alkaline phosphatase family protein [Tomitella biformata]|uniref:alkaline phosphatase family protein n=1 Tax=Tomitella biformata TaxID=630403 RepID=UPI0004675433|nr:alkaline phosphatase family protein [Tomitella biformata]